MPLLKICILDYPVRGRRCGGCKGSYSMVPGSKGWWMHTLFLA